MNNALQSHPPLEVAIGQLSAAEQSHAQVSMRVLSSHLKVQCVVVPRETADITLKPCADDAGRLCVSSAYGQAFVERPMRLAPLSDALTTLINGILARSGQDAFAAAPTASSEAASSHAAPSDSHASLLGLLLGRSRPGPLKLTLASGRHLLVDARYAVAHLSAPVSDMLPQLLEDALVDVATLGAAEFLALTGKDSALHPVAVEQLCWALAATDDTDATLARWHEDDQARVTLDTWPNLSAQHDSLAWLGVLAQLSSRGMSVADLRTAAVAAGIAPARARFGISLLLSYRHARIVASGASSDRVVVMLPTAKRNEIPSGLFGRLRSRLRALAA